MMYSAAKAALNAYSKSLASKLGQYEIRVNIVSPGMVRAPLRKEFITKIAKDENITYDEAFKEAQYLTEFNFRVEGSLLPTI